MTTLEEYTIMALEMRTALIATRAAIECDIMGKDKTLHLDAEAYQKLATTIFIEAHKRKNGGNGNGNGSGGEGKGNYGGEATENQQKFLAILAMEKEGADDIIAGFLDANNKKSLEELNASQASSLIDTLKPLGKKEKSKPNRAIKAKEDPRETGPDY
jgi:hypothetical protein